MYLKSFLGKTISKIRWIYSIINPQTAYISFFFGIFLLSFLVWNTGVYARPGGGHSFSSGGGGDLSDILIELLFQLLLEIIIRLPWQISVPLVLILFIIIIFRSRKKLEEMETITSEASFENNAQAIENIDLQVTDFKKEDPNFSKIVFLDFVSSLYNKYYTWQNTPNFKNVIPFLAENLKQEENSVGNKNIRITEIVIGSIQITKISSIQEYTAIQVDINSNYTVNNHENKTRYEVIERWVLHRKKGVLSLSPNKMSELSCPSCGAPTDFTDAGQCSYCKTSIVAGEKQWMLSNKKLVKKEAHKEYSLATYSVEIGTDYPTIFQKNLAKMQSSFAQNHHISDWNTYWNEFETKIVSTCFTEVYRAWSENHWKQVRHLLTDRLYESYSFWLENYKVQNLSNRLDKLQVQSISLVKVEMDKYYDSITVRIFASCLDYVINSEGKVVGGSKKKLREFSEYWTFIRRSGVEKNEPIFTIESCPHCGAQTDKMGQAGICGYCNSKISSGEFSWVLALITQDEVYD